MGQMASEIRKTMEKGSKDAENQEAERIKLLQELGDRLISKFQDDVRLDKDPAKFKIGKILTEYATVNLMTSEETKNIKDSVQGVVENIAKGDIAKCITTLVNFGIDAMLASASGAVAEKRMYTIKLEGIGIQRIDIFMYKYDLQSTGLMSSKEHMFVYAYTISTIGEEVKPEMLRSLIALTVSNIKTENGKEVPLEFKELIEKQMEIYGLLKSVWDDKYFDLPGNKSLSRYVNSERNSANVPYTSSAKKSPPVISEKKNNDEHPKSGRKSPPASTKNKDDKELPTSEDSENDEESEDDKSS